MGQRFAFTLDERRKENYAKDAKTPSTRTAILLTLPRYEKGQSEWTGLFGIW